MTTSTTSTKPIAANAAASVAGLILKIATALLMSFAVTLVLVHAQVYFSPSPLSQDVSSLF